MRTALTFPASQQASTFGTKIDPFTAIANRAEAWHTIPLTGQRRFARREAALVNDIDEIASMIEGTADRFLTNAVRLENAAREFRERANRLFGMAENVRTLIAPSPASSDR
jgi:hypothetical protein